MQRNTISNRQWEELYPAIQATVRVWKIFFGQKILADFKMGGLEMVCFIRADISIGSRASSAHFMSDQIKSNKVRINLVLYSRAVTNRVLPHIEYHRII